MLLRMRTDMRLFKMLQIQYQPLGLAAGAADHHPLILGLLFFAEDRVVVLRNPLDDALLAGTADAELAGIVDVDALIEQHFEDGASLRNEELLARARELDREATLLDLADVLFGREILDVDLRARPVLGGSLERIEHRSGAAAVDVRLLWR